MQRKALTPGKHYLYSDNRDWKSGFRVSEVEVLDTTDWSVSSMWSARREPWEFTTTTGETVTVRGSYLNQKPYASESHVLVRFVKDGRIGLVAPRELRGEWGDASAEWAATQAAQAREAKAERERRAMLRDRAADASDAFKELFGFEVYVSSEGRAHLRINELERMLAVARLNAAPKS
jgi:hypothetical protein